MTSKKKGRCWKGCKPVPGKKPYSKGSCSCGMAALTPGMIEFGAGSRIAELVGAKNPIKLLKGRSGLESARNSLATKAREVRSIDRVRGESLKKALQAKRARVANEAKGIYQAQKSAAMGALREDSELIQGALGSKNYFSPLAKKTKAVRASYGLEALEFARGDFAIPALKKALRKGIGNAGEPVAISEIGVSGTMIPSLRKNPKNVQRATKKYWGQDEGMAQATGAMRYNRDWAAKTIREDRSKRYMWPRRLTNEDSLPEPLRKARARSRMGLSPNGVGGPFKSLCALTPGMIEFAADNRLDANGYAPIARPKIYATPPRNAPYVSPYNSLIKPKVKGGLLARLKAATRLFEAELESLEFAADNRPRNGNGQYVGNETMGVDPNSMQAAYGNVEQEKMMRRRSLVQRMRAMMADGKSRKELRLRGRR